MRTRYERFRRAALLNIPVTLGLVMVLVLSKQVSTDLHFVLLPIVGTGVIGYWVFIAVRLLGYRRAFEYAARHRGRVCPYCGYLLPGEQGSGDCPECGATCPASGVVRYWGKRREARALQPEAPLLEECGIRPPR